MAGDEAEDGRREKRERLEVSIKVNLTVQAFVRMAFVVTASLTFMWSTVVLLGGYVSSLQKKDFQCLTVITVIEATIIFNELESHGNVKLDIVRNVIRGVVHTGTGVYEQFNPLASYMSIEKRVIFLPFVAIVAGPVYATVNMLNMFCALGPLICIGLSSWRLRYRDYYAASNGGASLANLTTALNFFYTLALCQGLIYCFLVILVESEDDIVLYFNKLVSHNSSEERVSKLSQERDRRSIEKYLQYTREKCARDPALVQGTSLLSFAVELLDSESQEDFLSGARMLDMLIKDGEDARTLILRSRTKIQRLLDTLDQRSGDDAEIRGLAARIVSDLADGIHLAHFPGAIWSVSSLLETTGHQALWNNINHHQHELSWADKERDRRRAQIVSSSPECLKPLIQKCFGIVEGTSRIIKQVRQYPREKILQVWQYPREKILRWKLETGDHGVQVQKLNEQVDASGDGGGCNQLIVQGLSILEKLARDPQNRREICAAPGLLAKITAPLYSSTLIEDISSSEPWANVAGGSLRAVRRLIHVVVHPERAGRRLCSEISSNKRAVSNLEGILHLESEEQLQMPAIEILTELAVDPSINISSETRENLVTKQLQIFLADGGEEEVALPATSAIKKDKKNAIKTTAGEMLSILSKSEVTSSFIAREHNHIFDRLTRILDGEYNIRYRTLSAEILENLCILCKDLVNETLLQKVREILTTSKREASEITTSAPGDNEGNRGNSSHGDDVEKQCTKQTGQGQKDQQANEDKADMKELQQALLSLTLVIHDVLFAAESSAPVTHDKLFAVETSVPVAQQSAARDSRDSFVDKLKAIVDDNCEQMTPVSLRIVKLCCQIVISCNRYATSGQKKEFLESVSKASKTMGNLESCMIFAGTDSGMDKIARPLLSDLEEKLNKLVA